LAALGGVVGLSGTVVTAACAGGVVGMMLDSLLGATVQASYYCESCDATTETPLHECGRTLTLRRGWAWVDNDVVNLAATASGGAVALALWVVW
jgi:uncharacterized membrane protein